jgi:hypothetical protein
LPAFCALFALLFYYFISTELAYSRTTYCAPHRHRRRLALYAGRASRLSAQTTFSRRFRQLRLSRRYAGGCHFCLEATLLTARKPISLIISRKEEYV